MNQQKKEGLSRLLEFAGNYRILTILSCVLSGLSAILSLGPFVCIWLVVRDIFAVYPHVEQAVNLAQYGWLAVGFSAGSILLYFAGLMCSHLAAFRTATNMKKQALSHLLKLPLGFFSKNTSGKLRKVIDDNAGLTEVFLAHQLPDLAGALIMPVAVLVLLLAFDWRLGLLCLVPLALGVVFLTQMMGGKNAEFMQGYMTALEDMNTQAVEFIRGIPVVKVFGQTVFSFQNFHASIMKYKQFASDYTLVCRVPMIGFTVAINSTFALLIPVGILLIAGVADYQLFLLDLIFYLLFAPTCAVMMNKILLASDNYMMAKEAARRIDEILQENPLPEPECPQHPNGASVEFRQVSFTYPGTERPALQNISFSVPQGTTVALVGSSGGGKSTAASLVPRFWDVESGSVTVGGVDVRHIASRDLMEQVAFVFQDTHLFKASILDNIRVVRPHSSREEVLRAAQAAQCSDILEKLPEGLDTVIGSAGVYLSGGEQQRIALARAMLKNAPIVVLDEATAFADPEHEHEIQKALEQLTRGKTVLLIAHRLSTVRGANQILVLADGKIQEQGTHDSLLGENGMYAGMWKDYLTSAEWKVTGKGEQYA